MSSSGLKFLSMDVNNVVEPNSDLRHDMLSRQLSSQCRIRQGELITSTQIRTLDVKDFTIAVRTCS